MARYQIDPLWVPLLNRLQIPVDDDEIVPFIAAADNIPPNRVKDRFDRLLDAGILQLVTTGSTLPALADSRYGVLEHQRLMLADKARTDGFRQALSSVVKSDDTVIDVGAGSGVLSFFAAQAGARKVWALETTKIVADARELARLNGVDDVVEFFHGDAGEFKAAGPADVIVSEWLGTCLIAEIRQYTGFAQVRDRFLRPGGAVIPRRARLMLAPVNDRQLYMDHGMGFWEQPCSGFDVSLGLARQLAKPRISRVDARPDSLIDTPWTILDVDCLVDDQDAFFFDSRAETRTSRSTVCHGYLAYFDADLAPDVLLDTSPFAMKTHWRQTYFPVKSFPIRSGDTLLTRARTTPSKITGYPQMTLDIELHSALRAPYQASYTYPVGDQPIG